MLAYQAQGVGVFAVGEIPVAFSRGNFLGKVPPITPSKTFHE
jgi:hypothetical protein